MKRIAISISGKVQDVGFRYFVKSRADDLGLVGFVKNLRNGCVKVVAEGREESLKRLVDICNAGPPDSKVKRVRVRSQAAKNEFAGFEIN